MVYPHGAVFSLFTVFVEESDSLGFYIISVLRLGARSSGMLTSLVMRKLSGGRPQHSPAGNEPPRILNKFHYHYSGPSVETSRHYAKLALTHSSHM